MTKHNGKARKGGEKVGSTLARRNAKGGPINTSAMFRHTTDLVNGQSILERGDLEELMAMADLADRDFTAERTQVVVISTGAVDPKEEERNAKERREAEDRHRHRLKLPRRPSWTSDTTADQLDLQERTTFLVWRRELAALEEEERLVLTPFEKNLEVWRQLWRVLERSDMVVQVVDARDPMLYRSMDLEAYARELHHSKSSFILLNKADLLPDHVRTAWADCFEKMGLDYAFWSAYSSIEDLQKLKQEAAELGIDVFDHKARTKAAQQEEWERQKDQGLDPRIRILDGEDLLDLLEEKAKAAVQAAGPDDPRNQQEDRRFVVGLVGFPNVGKSSTINALFGSKKTAVGPTPGKTKHFQTLNVSSTLCLCDCPGLVMPVFANSKQEMVAAGVIPIDRLSDIRSPIELIAKRLGRWQVEKLYGIRLPPPQAHEPANTPPTATQLLRSLALLRGWTAGMGLPDESRAGRTILRDYTSGKLVYCLLPLGSKPLPYWIPSPGDDIAGGRQCSIEDTEETDSAPAAVAAPPNDKDVVPIFDDQDEDPSSSGMAGLEGVIAKTKYSLPKFGPAVSDRPTSSQQGSRGAARGIKTVGGLPLDAADLDMLEGMAGAGKQSKRPEYKFNKKEARSKGDRGQMKGEGVFDGAAMSTGKKGGLVRVNGY